MRLSLLFALASCAATPHDTLLGILGPDHPETRAAATALETSKENST